MACKTPRVGGGNTVGYRHGLNFVFPSQCLQNHVLHHRFALAVCWSCSRHSVVIVKSSRCLSKACRNARVNGKQLVASCMRNEELVALQQQLLSAAAAASESTVSGRVEGDKSAQPKNSKISFDTVLQELSSIQKDGPFNIAILGTRHCSLLHQQIVELLTYANVLIGNHIYTSGGGGTNSAAIRGALRAEKPHLLTVILPQSRSKQPKEAQELLKHVTQVIEMPHNDNLPLDVSSRLCNSSIISKCQQLISFVFHDSDVLLEAVKETKSLKKLVTLLYLD